MIYIAKISSATLTRHTQNGYGTFGEISNSETGSHLCYTLERPWINNKSDVSCVPVGVYACTPHNSPDHPDTWEVTGVPNRSEVLIHTGNFLKNTKGCILVGMTNDSDKAVLRSQDALDYLHMVLDNNFTLTIVNAEQPV